MSRDHRKLRVFESADRAVADIYRITQAFPTHERYGLQAQLRRAAVSVPCNIVEGSARRSTAEYLQFLSIASGSAVEVSYLVGLAHRLGFIEKTEAVPTAERYGEIAATLKSVIRALERRE